MVIALPEEAQAGFLKGSFSTDSPVRGLREAWIEAGAEDFDPNPENYTDELRTYDREGVLEACQELLKRPLT